MTPGDAIVLIEAASANADEAALSALLSTLSRRNFILTAQRIDGDLIAAARAACAAHDVGCRLLLEHHHLASQPLRALVTTKSNAHLALTIVAERSGLFTAEAIGKLTRGSVEVVVDGAKQESLRLHD